MERLELVCKGCYVLGSACGKCERCREEIMKLYNEDKISRPCHEFAMAWGKEQRDGKLN